MKDNSFIFFDDSFTVHNKIIPIDTVCSNIKIEKVVYKGRFVKGANYNSTKHGPILDSIISLFHGICKSNDIPDVESNGHVAFSINNMKKKAKSEDVYLFKLVSFNTKLDKIIQDSIANQINIDYIGDNGEISPIDRCLTLYLEGKSFEVDQSKTTTIPAVSPKYRSTNPATTSCVLHVFNTVEKDLNKVLKAIGKLYMDSECMRVTKNKYICHDYIIEGSTACYIAIDRSIDIGFSSVEQNSDCEGCGDGIEIRLPDGIEDGFVNYLSTLTKLNGISAIIDQVIRVIDNIADSLVNPLSIRKEN